MKILENPKLKKVKLAQQLYEQKLSSIIQELSKLQNDLDLGSKEKFNYKIYFQNFEKDKKEIKGRIKKWEEERNSMKKLLLAEEKKIQEKYVHIE